MQRITVTQAQRVVRYQIHQPAAIRRHCSQNCDFDVSASYFVNNTYPDFTMTVYPRPTRDLEWHFISVEKINQPATLATQMLFPPGYLRAFTYNLAMEIAPEYGIEPSPQVQRIAMTSKRNLKRINNPDDVMSMPYAIVATRQRFNVYAGNY
jgi:hypothetical protein